jgi:hypothetical protein
MGWVCVFNAGSVTGVPVGGNTVVDWQRAMDVDADLVAGDDLPLAHVDVGLALDPVYLLGLDVEVLLAVERSLDKRLLALWCQSDFIANILMITNYILLL